MFVLLVKILSDHGSWSIKKFKQKSPPGQTCPLKDRRNRNTSNKCSKPSKPVDVSSLGLCQICKQKKTRCRTEGRANTKIIKTMYTYLNYYRMLIYRWLTFRLNPNQDGSSRNDCVSVNFTDTELRSGVVVALSADGSCNSTVWDHTNIMLESYVALYVRSNTWSSWKERTQFQSGSEKENWF